MQHPTWSRSRSAALGGAVASIGMAVVVGWVSRQRRLVAPVGATVTMPSAALGFLFGGLAIAAAARGRSRVSLTLSVLAGTIGALSLLEWIAGVHLGVDTIPVRDWLTSDTSHWPGRMPPETAAVLLLLGLATGLETRHPARSKHVLALSSLLTAVMIVSTIGAVGGRGPLLGLLDHPGISGVTVILGGLATAGVFFLIGDEGGPVHALLIDKSLRATVLRSTILPIPVIVIGPLVSAVLLLRHVYLDPGASALIAEIGTGTMFALMAGGALVGHVLARRIIDPLQAMQHETSLIASGHLDTPLLLVGTQGELGDLAGDFSQMRLSLARRATRDAQVRDAVAAASSSPNLAEAFLAFTASLQAVVPSDRVSMAAPRGMDEIEILAVAGPFSHLLAIGTRFRLGTELDDRLRTGKPASGDTRGSADQALRAASERGAASYCCVPVRMANETAILITFSSHLPGAYGVDDVATLEQAARSACAPLYSLYLLDQARATASRLEQLTQLQNDVASILAHDMRVPMTVIAGTADLLRTSEDLLSAAEKAQSLEAISRNTRRLSAMVEDILDVAEIDSGGFRCASQPFDIDDVVHRAADEIDATQADPHTIVITIPVDLAPAIGDQMRTWRVLSNLIGNACKYSLPDTQVDIVAERRGDFLRITVRDRGIGMLPEDVGHLFERFGRVHQPVTTTPRPGVGLGLYICKHFVEGQGGSIGITSKVGAGTEIWFTLPVSQVAAPEKVRATTSA